MCGIAGSFGRPLVPDAEMARALHHRGPDSNGSWRDPTVSLLHWRLAIIDLSPAGSQPMVSSNGRYVISYNGEIYNFGELRVEIEQHWLRGAAQEGADGRPPGRAWRGRSDTEVIVEGVATFGVAFLSRLNGMFAIAIYDRQTRTLYLARDRAGIKPLYVWRRGALLLFASEAKFFFRACEFFPAVSASGLSAYFTYAHSYVGHHVLKDVTQLEPGEILTCDLAPTEKSELLVRRGRLCLRPEWSPVDRSDAAAARELRALMVEVVSRQLVADVGVGVLLSGGIDSSILTALTARILGPASTMAFTLGYPGMGRDFDEIDHARRVAKHLGVQHFVYEASEKDLLDDLENVVWHFDEPFADAASLNVFALSRLIRSRVTVALAGEGSDELFGGYRRYQFEKAIRGLGLLGQALCAAVRIGALDRVGWLPRRAQVVLRAMSRRGSSARYSSYLQSELPAQSILKPEWFHDVGINACIEAGYPERLSAGPVSHLCIIDQQFWLPSTYLEKSDKASMAHSLEIRVPFLDNEVVDFANGLPDHQRIRGAGRKWLLRKAFGDLLPAEVFRRFKRGFAVPVGRWLRKELRSYYRDEVLSPSARVNAYLQMKTLQKCFRDHQLGVRDYSGVLWQSLLLEIWLRQVERGFRRSEPLKADPIPEQKRAAAGPT